MSEWQPIETLPHDGDEEDRKECGFWAGPVLVFVPNPHGGAIVVAQCDADEWIMNAGDHTWSGLEGMPTHWMPLPEPPVTERGTT